jgi:hypothetical protein
MARREKFKWKCKVCKKTNYIRRNRLERHIGDMDALTTDVAVVELKCGRCNQKNYVEVTGLLQSGQWEIRAFKPSSLQDPRAVVSKDVDLNLDEVRMLMAQGRVAPWSDLFEKETLLIYQVYVEEGDIKTRIRTHMLTKELLIESIRVLEEEIAEPYRKIISDDIQRFDLRLMGGDGGG